MKIFDLEKLVRKNILKLKPYSSARDEYTGHEALFLDANENPFKSDYNRYPDPKQRELKRRIAIIKDVEENQIFMGNGSDEPIDLLFRIFCEPGKDNVIIPDPTYGMYEVCADINDVEIKRVSLTNDFQLNTDAILGKKDQNTKIIFICSPNNPTANSMKRNDILRILNEFRFGIVVIDEAYIDFSDSESFLSNLKEYPNLVVLQTFSKAWGLAGIRLGMAFTSQPIVDLLTKVKYPYNINSITQKVAVDAIKNINNTNTWIEKIISQRTFLAKELIRFNFAESLLPSETNFLMLKVKKAKELYDFLVSKKIIVRDRSNVNMCIGYLRITVGIEDENEQLLQAMQEYDLKG